MTVAERIQKLKASIEANPERTNSGLAETPTNWNKIIPDWSKKDDFYNRPPGWTKFDNFKN